MHFKPIIAMLLCSSVVAAGELSGKIEKAVPGKTTLAITMNGEKHVFKHNKDTKITYGGFGFAKIQLRKGQEAKFTYDDSTKLLRSVDVKFNRDDQRTMDNFTRNLKEGTQVRIAYLRDIKIALRIYVYQQEEVPPLREQVEIPLGRPLTDREIIGANQRQSSLEREGLAEGVVSKIAPGGHVTIRQRSGKEMTLDYSWNTELTVDGRIVNKLR